MNYRHVGIGIVSVLEQLKDIFNNSLSERMSFKRWDYA
jgi:hypothetical protein